MKKLVLSLMAAAMFTTAFAQESESKFGVSADLVSRYVWRGTQFGTSPAIQPGLSYSTGGFTAGAWGSYSFDNSGIYGAGTECDLYASYAFDFGLSLVATDYFFPQDPLATTSGGYFNDMNHWFELGASYSLSKLTLSAYYVLNQENDMYLEAGYAFNDNLSLTLGAGDKMYSVSDDLNVCNIGLKYKKEVAITETFKVSPYASFIVNPNQEQVFLVLGLTL